MALESRITMLAGAAVIGVASLLAYLPSLRGGFLLDDDYLVTNSTLIAASDGLYRFWFTTEPFDYWPMVNSSFWIEWRLWGMNPTGYHVTNLVLHIASALLIWVILGKLSIPGAWLAALLFAVHPVNVESVAWIAQRKNTLSMLLFLLSILWYLKADRGVGLRRERSAERRWYALSLLAFTLAMLSKGSVAILPLVLLLLAWWQRGKIVKRDILRSAPFFVVAVVLAAVNVWFQTHGSGVEFRSATFVQRLLGAGAVVWFYLYKALVPVNLVFIYPQWDVQASELRWWLPLLAAGAVTAVLLWQRNPPLADYSRPLLFAWLFFCVALLPVMGFTDVGFMRHSLVADHYQHIAIIGVVTLVAAGLSLLYRRAEGAARSVRLWRIAAAALVAVLLTFLSWQQSRIYANPITLYEVTLVQNPRCWLVHNILGTQLIEAGQLEKAIEHYQQALLLNPKYADAEYNLGNAVLKTGRLAEAVEHYEQALRLKPNYIEAHNNLGNVLRQTGQLAAAIDHYEQALRLKPDHPLTHFNLATAFRQAHRLPEAMRHFEQALQWKPDYPEAHSQIGLALIESDRIEQAIEHFQQAVRLKPDFPEAHFNLGSALANSSRWPEAIEHFQQSLKLIPDRPETHKNLGIALAMAGRLPEAIDHYQEALRLRPDDRECYADLARAYAKLNRPQEAIATAQKALDLARSAGQTDNVRQIERWLTSYRASLKGQDTPLLPEATSPSP